MKTTIWGDILPAVTIDLEQGESIYTESGGMTWMSDKVKMDSGSVGLSCGANPRTRNAVKIASVLSPKKVDSCRIEYPSARLSDTHSHCASEYISPGKWYLRTINIPLHFLKATLSTQHGLLQMRTPYHNVVH